MSPLRMIKTRMKAEERKNKGLVMRIPVMENHPIPRMTRMGMVQKQTFLIPVMKQEQSNSSPGFSGSWMSLILKNPCFIWQPLHRMKRPVLK